MKEIFLASGNKHKLIEFQEALQGVKITPCSEVTANFSPVENGKTFLENAFIKAKELYSIVKAPVLADDSGLCVNALGGAPGIHSARYACVHAENQSGDMANIEKLLHELKGVTERSAYFSACVVLYINESKFFVVQESCEGLILDELRGGEGFGYDPVFFIPHLNRTMAQLTTNEKNAISHRGKALLALKQILSFV